MNVVGFVEVMRRSLLELVLNVENTAPQVFRALRTTVTESSVQKVLTFRGGVGLGKFPLDHDGRTTVAPLPLKLWLEPEPPRASLGQRRRGVAAGAVGVFPRRFADIATTTMSVSYTNSRETGVGMLLQKH